jgi:hypothetical protein
VNSVSGHWDASIRQIQALEGGVVFAPIEVVAAGEAFDVVATAYVGESLMAVVNCCDLFVAVRNLSRSVALANAHVHHDLVPTRRTLHKTLRAKICAGWAADDGDVLEVLATFKVTAGVHTDYSLARSEPFIVCI